MPIANTCSIGYPHDGRADNAAYRHDRRADNAAYRHDRRADSLSRDSNSGTRFIIIISLSTDNVLWSGVVSSRFGCGLGAQLACKQMDTMII